ncbi:MAG: N-acetylmuramoyl-L-alanine amidase [Chitinophagales bacterium]
MSGDVQLVVNGRLLPTRTGPRLVGREVMVPLRQVVESCGGTVDYDGGTPAKALVRVGETRLAFTEGQDSAVSGANPTLLHAAPAVWDDTFFVPSSALSLAGIGAVWYEPVPAVLCGVREARLAGRRVMLDPGHGGADPGAVGPGGTAEKEVTLQVAETAARLLTLAGGEGMLTRATDRNVSLAGRVAAAANKQAELLVSVHCNSYREAAAHGTETYYYELWEGQKLAALIQQEVIGELGLSDRGIKEANFYVLRYAKIPACLVEVAFLSNHQEERMLQDPLVRLKAGLAIFRGIRAFCESAAGRWR